VVVGPVVAAVAGMVVADPAVVGLLMLEATIVRISNIKN